MRKRSCWLLVIGCGLILTVEAPLVISSVSADLEGAYPAWERLGAPDVAGANPFDGRAVALPAAELTSLPVASQPIQARAAERAHAPRLAPLDQETTWAPLLDASEDLIRPEVFLMTPGPDLPASR